MTDVLEKYFSPSRPEDAKEQMGWLEMKMKINSFKE
jgi:hypothetical protein